MNNLNYYGLERLKFDVYKLNEEFAALKISYKPKHLKESIILKSMMCYTNEVINNKILWLFEDYKEPMYTDLVNNPEDYKHIKRS